MRQKSGYPSPHAGASACIRSIRMRVCDLIEYAFAPGSRLLAQSTGRESVDGKRTVITMRVRQRSVAAMPSRS